MLRSLLAAAGGRDSAAERPERRKDGNAPLVYLTYAATRGPAMLANEREQGMGLAGRLPKRH